MKIDIYLNNDRNYSCSNLIIGKTYENEATKLWFMLDEKMYDKDFYLEFEKIDGTKFSTPKLEIQEEIIESEAEKLTIKYVEYAIPNSLLDIAGDLKVEVVLRKDGTVFKTYTIKFTILNSINASEDMPNQYPDFISEAQQVIDLVKTDGTGEKYLSDNGTYKEVSGGTTDYNNLSNKPIKYLTGTEETPIYFNNLETGLYIFNGTCQPYKDADLTGFANNIFAQVLKTDEYISLMYDDLTNNEIEYFKVMIDGSSYESKSYNLNDLKPKEKIITSDRTTISTRLYDNYNYQVSSVPTRILLNFDESKTAGFRCTFVFKTGDTVPQFQCNYDIKWHGDSVEDNKFTIKSNKSYTLEFWQDVNCFNANVREV